MPKIRPDFQGQDRALEANARRKLAADQANPANRGEARPNANGDNTKYPSRPMAFAKGLLHDGSGLASPAAIDSLVDGLNTYDDGFSVRAFDVEPGGSDVAQKEKAKHITCVLRDKPEGTDPEFRKWESPLAGHYYSLEGSDADAVAMAPAPKFGESELCGEMAEVYAMALTRDMPFAQLANHNTPLTISSTVSTCSTHVEPLKVGQKDATLGDMLTALNTLSWFEGNAPTIGYNTKHETRKRAARGGGKGITIDNLFRGSSPGCLDGPYLSQFLLIGTKGKRDVNHKQRGVEEGIIEFGANTINQRVVRAKLGIDYMTSWAEWRDVQQGLKLNGLDLFEGENQFISTPRDLATYVHFDQLYQAYFNACLILLENGAPFDIGFPNYDQQSRGPFASFGGPHILSLMTEVATRGLKAVRRQKFQIHLRARPEVLAARITLGANGQSSKLVGDDGKEDKDASKALDAIVKEFGLDDKKASGKPDMSTFMSWIKTHNECQNSSSARAHRKYTCDGSSNFDQHNYLLPMAFPEGSPMHAAYGAGHATVAGACITVLKAFFEMFEIGDDGRRLGETDAHLAGLAGAAGFSAPTEAYEPPNRNDPNVASENANKLVKKSTDKPLTLEGELNKLAANISIGRNMAGVHYFTDYFDSLRMGERIAIGILQEQMLNYHEQVSMTFRSFDGDLIAISTDGKDVYGVEDASPVTTTITNQNGDIVTEQEWWERHIGEYPADANAKSIPLEGA